MKLYLDEPGTTAVRERLATIGIDYCVRVTYVEARAAFARARREKVITVPDLRRIVRDLDEDWTRLAIVEVSESLVRRAGTLAERRGLRGYDAIQLAAALEVGASAKDLEFLSFDHRLVVAARRERLRAPDLAAG